MSASKRSREFSEEDINFDATASAAISASANQKTALDSVAQMLQTGSVEAANAGTAEGGHVGYAVFMPGTHYPAGSFVRMPLEQVIENPRNPRVYFREEDMRSLELSIATSGQQEAAKVFFHPASQKYMLKGGHRRYRTLSNLRHPTIDVQVIEQKDGLEEFREARELNTESKGQTHLDDAVRFPEMMAEYKLDNKGFAKRINMSEAEVSKRVKIGKVLPRDILDLMAESVSVIGVEASYRLAQIYEANGPESSDFVKKLVSKLAEGGLTIKQLKQLAEKKQLDDSGLTQRPAGKRQLPVQRAVLAGRATGSLKAFDRRLEVNLDGLSPEDRDELFEIMLKVLEEKGYANPAS